MSPEEKIKHIIQNSACVIRIGEWTEYRPKTGINSLSQVPTRTTSYTHLRDAFVRALQARVALARKEGTLSEEDAFETGGPIRKLKTLFPNTPLSKHTPLDIFLPAPIPGQTRSLIFRDLGSIEGEWVAVEFILHYFEGDGPSPPVSVLPSCYAYRPLTTFQLKKSVLDTLAT